MAQHQKVLHLKIAILAITLAVVLFFRFFFDFGSWVGNEEGANPEEPAGEVDASPTE